MKRIVAYNKSGDLVAKYRTIKVVAKEFDTTAYFIRKALLGNKQVKGIKFMYEVDYERAIENHEKIGWGMPYQPKRKYTKEKILEKESEKAYRRINRMNNFREWAKTLLDWFSKLGERYKERGDYNIYPTIIADFYEKAKDKEIALFSSLMLSENDNLYSQVADMRQIITSHPFQWFKRRGFVSLSTGSKQHKKLTGNAFCEYWKIAKMFDRLWHIMFDDNGEPTGYTFQEFFTAYDKRPLCENIRKYLNGHSKAADELQITDYKVRLLLFVLCKSDGIGMGLWNVPPRSVKVPISRGMQKFLRMLFPDYSKCGDIDEIIDGLGFRSNFLYVFLGWVELCKLYPQETERFVNIYSGWHKDKRIEYRRPSKWLFIFPPML